MIEGAESGDDQDIAISRRDARDLIRVLHSLEEQIVSRSEHAAPATAVRSQTPSPRTSTFDNRATGMHPLCRPEFLERAHSLIRMRRRRQHYFPAEIFGEAAWDILLNLYLATGTGQQLTIAGAIQLAKTSGSTGLRWIALLDQAGLIIREPNPFDRRAILIRLSDHGMSALESFLDELGEGFSLTIQPV